MEKSIMSYIHNSLPDTTIVFVTHKMSTISLYSRIIYIDNGKILADGDFTTVLAEVEQFRINTNSL
jgi:ABC-type transport system involved in cytochrome bd biosynthesis fused ATPase/permease subunit